MIPSWSSKAEQTPSQSTAAVASSSPAKQNAMSMDIRCCVCHERVHDCVFTTWCPGLFCQSCLDAPGAQCPHCRMDLRLLHPAIPQPTLNSLLPSSSSSSSSSLPSTSSSTSKQFTTSAIDLVNMAAARAVVTALVTCLNYKRLYHLEHIDALASTDVPFWVSTLMRTFPNVGSLVRSSGFGVSTPGHSLSSPPVTEGAVPTSSAASAAASSTYHYRPQHSRPCHYPSRRSRSAFPSSAFTTSSSPSHTAVANNATGAPVSHSVTGGG